MQRLTRAHTSLEWPSLTGPTLKLPNSIPPTSRMSCHGSIKRLVQVILHVFDGFLPRFSARAKIPGTVDLITVRGESDGAATQKEEEKKTRLNTGQS